MNITLSEFDILNIIQDSLSNKKPLLITRFGEGEMRMYESEEQTNWILKNMLGYVPDPKIIIEIKNNMELALINSDITGLPSYKKFLKEEDVMKTDLHFLYKKIYHNFRNIFSRHNVSELDFKFCDVNVHSKFTHSKLFEKLLSNYNDLTIITCRDIENELKNYFNIKNIHSYLIPPEYKYEDNPNSKKWNFYPDIHNQIKTDILSNDNTGKLLLYGAGLAGKDLGYYFKKTGGVAFDIGSIFDHWAGKKTRGEGKGRGIYFESPLKTK
jgi:hypothetical protein